GGDDGSGSSRGVRWDLDLCADAALEDEGSGRLLRGECGGGGGEDAPAWPVGGPGVDDVSGDDEGAGATDAGADGAGGGPGLLSLLQPGACGSWEPGVADEEHAEGDRGDHGAVPGGRGCALFAGDRSGGAGEQ